MVYASNLPLSPPPCLPRYAPVRADFVSQKISEAELKEGLVVAINRLLQPVRDHFAGNDRGQKDLLARVQGYKRDKLKATAGAVTTRLGTSMDEGQEPPVWTRSGKPVWAVFAPAADLDPSLGAVLTTLRQLRAAPDDHEILLWVPDWGTRVLNRCGAEMDPTKHADNVDAAYNMYVHRAYCSIYLYTRTRWLARVVLVQWTCVPLLVL